MSHQPTSRFTPQNKTTNERLSTHTVGLVALSDFRKRRAEVLEQQEREAREAVLSSTHASTPDRSLTATPNNASDSAEAEKLKSKKQKKKRIKALVSFGEDEDGGADGLSSAPLTAEKEEPKGTDDEPTAGNSPAATGSTTAKEGTEEKPAAKLSANTSVGIVPRALTKAALRREAAEREALRKEFLLLQTAIKATEIAVPFVFYDGTNTPGGIVRVKKGDFVWLFLDKSRKVGAVLGVGGDKNSNARRDWARVGVDDLILVRGSIIIPHHYEFYFFVMNKTVGPGNKLLFDYSAEAPLTSPAPADALSRPGQASSRGLPDITTLEGASDDPNFTKVVDRRWYQRNKHIYPASVWQEFEPEKDYQREIPRDTGGNAFFFSK
ncbi:XAP5, circadian clock regulator-domain-containing protein [Lasiosphaeria miniovina]|uniref:XAP5, circadian clock regulator-domain-containing protein n=1 Tax=Lasiosphaeria miniovina TaxID=1954250 RepID=A0AA40AL53_9PEZI|nr:XAP5, circadian clock regulator-domain-containing protein [Lasiosphaeria miniovina]KAK0717871.1 XAP5, circadian clock regulator-domain-containing protein [Lasiosphaeria miniovina]